MKKNRCSLCGGKLRNNICTECGLDNTKNDSNYKLNVSSCDGEPMTHVHTQIETRKAHQTVQQHKTWSSSRGVPRVGTMNPRAPHSRTAGHSNSLAKIIALIVVFIFIGGIGGFISSITDEMSGFDDFLENIGLEEWMQDEDAEVDYDPYQYTDNVLPEAGDYFDEVMAPGMYIVGRHIPEGRYYVKLLDGSGSFSVSDYENSIYISEFMQEGEEYSVEEYEDLRLFTGATLKISSGMHIQMTSENAQTEKLVTDENPLTESVEVKSGMVAGKDFEPGFYDIHMDGGENNEWGIFSYRVPGTLSKELMEESDTMTDLVFYNPDIEKGNKLVFCNLSIPEGTLLRLEDSARVTLVPSANIASTDYFSYYDILYDE